MRLRASNCPYLTLSKEERLAMSRRDEEYRGEYGGPNRASGGNRDPLTVASHAPAASAGSLSERTLAQARTVRAAIHVDRRGRAPQPFERHHRLGTDHLNTDQRVADFPSTSSFSSSCASS